VVTIGSPRLFVTDRGRGAPVLLIHGQPGLGRDWDLVSERLSGYRLVVPDRPGYGRSAGDAIGIGDNADAMARVLVERRAEPAIVVGHSYGGGVAILLAARHPGLVAGLVLVGSVGRADSVNGLDRVLALPVVGEAFSAAGLFTLGHVLPRLRWAAGERRHPTFAWLRASLPDAGYVEVSSRFGRRVWRSFVTEQRILLREIGTVEEALRSVRAPTVVISGSWDLVVPPSVSASVAAAIAGSELVTVARVGHFVPRDAPDVVAAAVRRVAGRAPAASGGASEPPQDEAGAQG
jgi:pimeloyl-ACP methyl ester carboxylesterase